MTSQFDGWKKLLAIWQANPTKPAMREAVAAAGLQILETEPLCGFYRHPKSKGGPLEPVAIYRGDGDGELHVLWGYEEALLEKVWTSCAWMPVPYEWYEAKVEHGKEWPDVHTKVQDEPARDLDEAEALKIVIERTKQGIEAYHKIEDDETLKRSQSLRSDLLALARKADKRREELKRPHFEAGRAIDSKFNPLVREAQSAADIIRIAQETWENMKLAREREEQRKREEEERQRAVEEQKRMETGQPPLDHNQPPAEPEAAARVAPSTIIKGGTGRAAHIHTKEVIIEVTDWTALFNYLRNDADVRRLLKAKAQRVLDATGEIPPGVKTETRRKVA